MSTEKFDKMKEAVYVNTQLFEEIVLFQDFQFSERIPRVLPGMFFQFFDGLLIESDE